jgi:predicted ATPase
LHPIRHGEGRVLWLAGETGVGKTRLAAEVLRLAAAEGMTVLSGAAYALEGQLPFQPFREAFDRYLAEQQRSPEQNPVARAGRSGNGNHSEERWAVFRATAALLNDAAAQAPVILAIDNPYAADEASLQLFHYLARHTRSSPLVLLATDCSDTVTPPTSPLNNLRQSLYRERLSETIRLEPLDTQASAQLIAYLLGGAAVPGFAQTMFDLTRGFPFFLEELARMLQAAGHLVRDKDGWQLRSGVDIGAELSAELRELIHARVQRLGPTVEVMLTTAAMLGPSFHYDDLHQTTRLSDSALLDALEAALAGCMLEETADGYRFRCPLVGSILGAARSRERRARLRRYAAEAGSDQ